MDIGRPEDSSYGQQGNVKLVDETESQEPDAEWEILQAAWLWFAVFIALSALIAGSRLQGPLVIGEVPDHRFCPSGRILRWAMVPCLKILTWKIVLFLKNDHP